jgi:hypothetical protein
MGFECNRDFATTMEHVWMHNAFVASIVQIPTKDTLKSIQRIQTVTIAWMSVEAVLSLWAAWMARSPALVAFGGDSAVELCSAVV